MNPRSLMASAIAAWMVFFTPPAANAQSRSDSVVVLVQAAHVAIDSLASGATIYLDPRTELQQGSLAIMAFEALQGAGYEAYASPGIPPTDVWLLSPGEIRDGKEGAEAFARLWAFGDKLGLLNSYSYEVTFRVECDERGCVLGSWLSQRHGDGHMSADCWDDFFARAAEDRRRCRRR